MQNNLEVLSANLIVLAEYAPEKLAQVVYDALLHMQNTSDATVEQAISQIEKDTEDLLEAIDYQVEFGYRHISDEELPF